MSHKIITLNGKTGQAERIAGAKWAYTTRRVPQDQPWNLIHRDLVPQAGDLVLARVKRLGQHKRLELPDGRRARMFPHDDVVVTYGSRYAPDQFEAIVPEKLAPCDLVAAGGIASQMVFRHESVSNPTQLEPVGLLSLDGKTAANLKAFALPATGLVADHPPVIAVVGSSMNSGKTTTAASLVRGLSRAGLRVNAAKITGTGAGGDVWFFKDAGADQTMDFIDAGHPSTYLLSAAQVKENFLTLLGHLSSPGTDVIVIEIADGLFQAETAQLVTSQTFARHVKGVIFTAADSLGGAHGVQQLRQWKVNILALGGMVTRSPLSMRELQDVVNLPVLGRKALRSPMVELYLKEWVHPTHQRLTKTKAQS